MSEMKQPVMMHIIDISGKIDVPPFWMLSLPRTAEPENLVDLERVCAKTLGVVPDGTVFADRVPLVYDREDDARRCAIEMMRRRPDLQVSVSPSDPAYGPSYVPLAHINVKTTFNFGSGLR